MDALQKIQAELKAPKGQYNSFGKYAYRSAEDILEAVKPLLKKNKAELILSDEIVEVGGRIYVKATAMLNADGEKAVVNAYAREPEQKKGMDESQITGTASSYARKYALNGLFLIDDTKDADTDEYKHTQNNAPHPAPKQSEQKQPIDGNKKINRKTIETLEGMIAQTNSDRGAMLGYYGIDKLEDMTADMAKDCYAKLKGKLNNG
jgi:hypothetical protein